MFVATSLICDLRRDDNDMLQSSIMAQNVAESIWEFIVFTAAHSRSQALALGISAIGTDGSLHVLLRESEFSLMAAKTALLSLSRQEFHEKTETGTKDPLSVAIDFASFASRSEIRILAFQAPRHAEVERSIKRATESEIEVDVILLSNQEDSSEFVRIENNKDALFDYFRSLAKVSVACPIRENLQISDQVVECLSTPLILPPIEIKTIDVCKCHQVPAKSKAITSCAVSEKRINSVYTQNAIGGFSLAHDFEEQPFGMGISNLVVLCRIDSERVSESLLFGTSKFMRSSSPVFHRLINEMRCHKQALLVKQTPTRVIGGEFWLLKSDRVLPVIHCKRVANRTQVMEFNESSDVSLPSDVCQTPVLPSITEVQEISPFDLGHEEILALY